VSNFKNIIWDFNGTIIDDAQLCCDAYNHVFSLHSKPEISLTRLSEIWCLPVKKFFSNFGFEQLDRDINLLCEQFHDYYGSRWSQCALQPGVLDLIAEAREQQLGQAVLSGHPQDYLLEMLEYFNLSIEFEVIRGVDTIVAVDKIEVGRELMRQMAWIPNETVLIGDSNFDVETAEALGISCLLVARGIQSRSRLEACGVPVFDSLDQLKKVL
jgi:phosphoglycolate phosphatase